VKLSRPRVVATTLAAALGAAVLGTAAAASAAAAVTPAATAAAADITQVPCTSSGYFAVYYDSFTRKACFAGLGQETVSIPHVDEVYTGDYYGTFELYYNGTYRLVSFAPFRNILVSPENTYKMVHIDLTAF
jgi:hypothetical protein